MASMKRPRLSEIKVLARQRRLLGCVHFSSASSSLQYDLLKFMEVEMHKSIQGVALVLAGLMTAAASAQPASAPVPTLQRELIYCADRMTPEEREAYRVKMRAARSVEEKDKVRAAHQAEMQARADRQGDAGKCEAVGRQYRQGAGQ